MADAVAAVRETTAYVAEHARHVSIDAAAVEAAADVFCSRSFQREWDSEAVAMHYASVSESERQGLPPRAGRRLIEPPSAMIPPAPRVQDGTPASDARLAQYLLVVDSLNFCFWPEPGLEYAALARGIAAALGRDPEALSAPRLSLSTPEDVRGWLREGRALTGAGPGSDDVIPFADERARLVREVGAVLGAEFEGETARLVSLAGGSAARLVSLVAMHFPGFRDHAVYAGRQVFLYKRAQIFVADVWGAFRGQGLGSFGDIDRLTMFADYRVPVVLAQMGVLRYSAPLAARLAAGEELEPGCAEEVELRALSIVAVERVREATEARWASRPAAVNTAPPGAGGDSEAAGAAPVQGGEGSGRESRQLPDPDDFNRLRPPNSVQIDWLLWGIGEAERKTAPPHHRCRTTFY